MRAITLEELLEAGCHFGHQVTRQNPKARGFIFEARDNIHIIDLAKTKEGLEEAVAFVKALSAKEGATLLLLGTKRQARGIVKTEINRAQEVLGETHRLFFVTQRWIGGILTNFEEVAKNFKRLKDLNARLTNEEEKAKYTKKEVGLLEKQRAKLELFYGGVSDMERIPDALFIIDTHLEDLAVREGTRVGVPIVGIVDTNADPSVIDYPIPANDDAVGSIKLIVGFIMDAWIEGWRQKEKEKVEEVEKGEDGGKRKPRATKKTA